MGREIGVGVYCMLLLLPVKTENVKLFHGKCKGK